VLPAKRTVADFADAGSGLRVLLAGVMFHVSAPFYAVVKFAPLPTQQRPPCAPLALPDYSFNPLARAAAGARFAEKLFMPFDG